MLSRRTLIRTLQLHGLQVTDDAIEYLLKKSADEGDSTLLDRVLATLDLQKLRHGYLEKRTVEHACAALSASEQHQATAARIQVVAAHQVPNWRFDEHSRQFQQVLKPAPRAAVFGTVDDRRALFAERYNLVWQRIVRNPLFAQPVLPTDALRRVFHKLTHVHALRGSPGGESLTVLGVLTQPSEGVLMLEDLTDSVVLDLSHAKCTAGLFAENCVVIARGQLVDGAVFRVSELGLPPAERRAETLENVTVVGTNASSPNFFGGVAPAVGSADWEDDPNERVLFLSDVRFDQPQVMAKLCALFDGYIAADCVPAAFVLIGNFCSPERDDAVVQLADALERLGVELLARPALLEQSYFIFVPGPSDAGGTSVRAVPTMELPSIATSRMTSRARLRERVIFTTNPCHIRVGRQEIVVFRDDIAEKLRRHSVVPPTDDQHATELSQHVVKTLLDESHLCPLPMSARPIAWPLDHSLRLYPLPDVVVMADSFAQFEQRYEDCIVLNPGSFPVDFSFVAFATAAKVAEFCIVKAREPAEETQVEDAPVVPPVDMAVDQKTDDGKENDDNDNADDDDDDEQANDEDEEAARVKLDDLDEDVADTANDGAEQVGNDDDDEDDVARSKRQAAAHSSVEVERD
jgi:DNA polymerase epsilon subunit 2